MAKKKTEDSEYLVRCAVIEEKIDNLSDNLRDGWKRQAKIDTDQNEWLKNLEETKVDNKTIESLKLTILEIKTGMFKLIGWTLVSLTSVILTLLGYIILT